MFLYHALLFKNNKLKFMGIIIIYFFVALLCAFSIISFYREDPDIPCVILLGVLQLLNTFGYFYLKLIYREEIFLLKSDKFHPFITNKKAYLKMIKNKAFQITLFFLYFIIMIIPMAIVFNMTFNQGRTLLIHLVLSAIVIPCIYINNVAVLNKYRDHYFDGILFKIFWCSLFVLSFMPSYKMLLLVCTSFILITLSNFILIIKGYGKRVKDHYFIF